MINEYKEINKEDLELAYGSAWSIENIEAHGADSRSVEYIGSTRAKCNQNIVVDYYRDSNGGYWYRNRAIVGGQLVSMEEYIFGRKVRTYHNRREKHKVQ